MSYKYLLQKFSNGLSASGLQENTIRAYIADIQQYCKWFIKHFEKSVEDAHRKDAEAFLQYLTDTTHELRPGVYGSYSPATIKRKISIVRRFYSIILDEK